MVGHKFPQLGLQHLWAGQIADPQAATGNLVLIGRTNTPAGGADLVVATGALTGLINTDVGRQDDRAGVTDVQALANRYAPLLKLTDFLEQGFR